MIEDRESRSSALVRSANDREAQFYVHRLCSFLFNIVNESETILDIQQCLDYYQNDIFAKKDQRHQHDQLG